MAANMLAYSIESSPFDGSNNPPTVTIGWFSGGTRMHPAKPQDDSYWIVILDSKNPQQKVKEWIVPGTSNSTVPAGIDTYMNNPAYLFVVTTQYLSTVHVPQGAFYDFLVKYGAGKELQQLEQLNSALGCGTFGRVSYILTGQCGPRGQLPPPSYERGCYSFGNDDWAVLMMSLMSQPDGSPPYSIIDRYTFKH
jgi:hypothetical protein